MIHCVRIKSYYLGGSNYPVLAYNSLKIWTIATVVIAKKNRLSRQKGKQTKVDQGLKHLLSCLICVINNYISAARSFAFAVKGVRAQCTTRPWNNNFHYMVGRLEIFIWYNYLYTYLHISNFYSDQKQQIEWRYSQRRGQPDDIVLLCKFLVIIIIYGARNPS